MTKEEKKEYRAKYYQNNKERVYELNKIWRKDNLEKARETERKWKKNNPDKVRAKNIKSRLLPTTNYAKYKKNAIDRNYEFNITLKEFKELWEKPCVYCGNEIKKIGIDRVDNTIGYIKNNIVPCCKICNFMKRDMKVADFLNHTVQITNNITKKALR